MRITKILNNNAVVVLDENQEKIAIGAGVAFQKKKNDLVNQHKIEKLFVMDGSEKVQQLQQLIERIPEEHFTISEEIIAYAERVLGSKLNDHIHIVLTDHISFAIERTIDGIHLKNKLFQEIKILYKTEFEIGLWAIQLIKEKLNVDMPVDEAAFLALHIHTMKMQGGSLRKTVKYMTIVREMVGYIQEYLPNIVFEEDDIAYQRLITHLHFTLARAEHDEMHTMDKEMIDMMRKKFQSSFECGIFISDKLRMNHQIELSDEEIGFISLHIERLSKHSFNK